MDGTGGRDGEGKQVVDKANVVVAGGRAVDAILRLTAAMWIEDYTKHKQAAQDAADAMRDLERIIDHIV